MMKKVYPIMMLLLMAVACKISPPKDEVMVFCAAGLTNVMQELVDSFELRTHDKVLLNCASSGTLARQMEQGAKADVYLAADVNWADYVAELGLVDTAFQTTLAGNGLALITSVKNELEYVDSTLDILSLLNGGRLAIGNPKHVPAGRYAIGALRHYGRYLALEEHLLLCKDVRSALMTVELNEAPLGIVYTTDARLSPKVKILSIVSPSSYSKIKYVASLRDSKYLPARAFYNFIRSEEVEEIWLKYGFEK